MNLHQTSSSSHNRSRSKPFKYNCYIEHFIPFKMQDAWLVWPLVVNASSFLLVHLFATVWLISFVCIRRSVNRNFIKIYVHLFFSSDYFLIVALFLCDSYSVFYVLVCNFIDDKRKYTKMKRIPCRLYGIAMPWEWIWIISKTCVENTLCDLKRCAP